MALELDTSPGQTPLDPDEAAGLIAKHITTQGDLNEWEQANILEAIKWLATKRHREVLTEGFCRELHKRMFGKTWKWAGQFRRSDKNIGVDWRHVAVRLRALFDDTRYWFEHGVYSTDEAAVRFHHRLVVVHPFPNGNGRHARMMTDVLLKASGAPPFSWGGQNLVGPGEARTRYLDALRAADAGDIGPLTKFVRS
ncbi:Adenosine monophosphate-protein transferase NmFic [Azoarcus sp. Aa7]|nr:Adenosine monophosphate-protein transferase NmFic [Azoarcus sp. Aa7]